MSLRERDRALADAYLGVPDEAGRFGVTGASYGSEVTLVVRDGGVNVVDDEEVECGRRRGEVDCGV